MGSDDKLPGLWQYYPRQRCRCPAVRASYHQIDRDVLSLSSVRRRDGSCWQQSGEHPRHPAVRAIIPPNDTVLSLSSETIGCSSSGGIGRWGHLTADGRHIVVTVVGDSSGGMSRWGHVTADGQDVVVAVVGDNSGGMSRWGRITADGRSVVAVVGDNGCSSSGGFNRWSHITAEGRVVVAVVGDDGCSSSGGISRTGPHHC